MKFGKFIFAMMAMTLTLLALTALPLSGVSAQTETPEPQYENLDSSVDLMASYYNAINRQEYVRAYGYWQGAPNTYEEFAAGFADTLSVQLIVQPPTSGEGAAGSTYVAVPTVLIADHTDGTKHLYSGCFVTRKSNLQPPDIPQLDVWHLYSADITETPATTANFAAIPTLLSDACDNL